MSTGPPSAEPVATGFRRDVEGLRAVAVLLVLAFHAGLPLHQGLLGVDVFFVISGYLITGILLRELNATGTISWGRFLGRRIRRLLPAAVLVLAVTGMVAWFVVPGVRRAVVGTDIAGAALYAVNWVLAHRAVDYLAADVAPSPVQHYWSLSVEEQFYVLWPLALIALGWLTRRVTGRRPGPVVVAAVLTVLTVPSFGYAVWLGHTDPARSYFVTTTRVWELGIGAALALAVTHSRLPHLLGRHPRVAAVVGWAGLAGILGTAYRLPAGAVWPGPWTLLPTVGAAAVLASGLAGTRGPGRLLSTGPMVWVGGLSYSLYLWHWPALVLAEWALGPLGTPQKVAVMALAVLPAWASLRFVERPVHHSRLLARRVRPTLALGVTLSAAAALVGVPLSMAPSVFRTTPVSRVRPDLATLGAATLADPPSADPASYSGVWDWVTPDPERAGQDRPDADVDRCQVDRLATEPVRCDFGDPTGPTTIALVGDSKAMQWLPALQVAAESQHWRIVTYGKSGCSFADGRAALASRPYPACDAWNNAVMADLAALRPDLVVTSGFAATAWDGRAATRESLATGLGRRWADLRGQGIAVLPIADNPVSPDDLDICAARHPRDLSPCAFDRAAAVAGGGAGAQRAAAAASGTALSDFTAWICPTPRCPVVIGHVAVNRAGDHLTASYVRTLAPRVARAVKAALASGPG